VVRGHLRKAVPMTEPRRRLVSGDQAGFYHCISRCVRRAFLCGADAYTGRNFEHRKAWIEERLVELASIFAVSLYGYAVMSNHLHVVLYVEPRGSMRWPDREVARRWRRLFPRGGQVEDSEVDRLAQEPDRIAELRSRLGSLSWFMRCLNEPIARRANREDDCTGRFWQGRFKSQALLDERAVLAAMAYVDLNPIRAGVTDRLDRSNHTSVSRRLQVQDGLRKGRSTAMAPLAGLQHDPPLIAMTEHQYVELVRVTASEIAPRRTSPRDPIPSALLVELGLSPASWIRQVRAVGSPGYRVLGCASRLRAKAAEIGQRWFRGISLARELELV
jgi:REP element-mobilizing transposase RayT